MVQCSFNIFKDDNAGMGRLAAPENPDVHLETMEEAKNESRKPKEAGLAGMASLRGGVLPEGLLEQCETCQRTNGDYEQETRTSRILQSIRQVRVPALMRLNRRVPNGTHGGVGGRSLNEWVSSYPIAVFTVLFLSNPDGFPAEKHRFPGWKAPVIATG